MLLSRLLGRLWFRTLQREGDLPAGPALLVLNHPNGLLDALVPSALLDPPPRFVAKATLWRIPVLWPFLALFAPIAVQRRQDQEVTAEATARTFAGVHRALASGEVVALFPEGISHAGADLARLKTGAARLCLTSPSPCTWCRRVSSTGGASDSVTACCCAWGRRFPGKTWRVPGLTRTPCGA